MGGLPLLAGPPGGDDAYYHAMYAVEHARCLAAGVVFPRWYPDLNGGLGGPEPRPRPLLPLLASGALAWLLQDAVAALVVVTALTPLLAGIVTLLALRRVGVPTPRAALGAAVWAAAPYLVTSLHQRVAIQECLALAVLPWVFACLLPPGPRDRRDVVGGALAVACLLATQLLVSFMAALAVAAVQLVHRERQPLRAARAVVMGAALAAVSWLPNVVSLARQRSQSFVSGWFDWRDRFLFTGGDGVRPASEAMGWVFVGVGLAALVLMAVRDARPTAAVALGCAALSIPVARPLWEVVPGFALLQFPWRWLGVASALVVWAASVARAGRWGGAALVALALPLLAVRPTAERLPAGPPLRPAGTSAEIASAATRFGVLPILPSFPAALPRGADPFAALRAAPAARAALTARERGPVRWSWEANSPTGGVVRLPILADDGWEVRVGGRRVGWSAEESLVAVPVPAGRWLVEARQVLLPEDMAGIAISALAWAVLLGAAWRRLSGAAAGRASPPAG